MNDEKDDKLTAGLMRLAGRQTDVPEDVESRVYDRVLQEWTDESQAAKGEKVYRKVERSWRYELTRKRLLQWAAPMVVAASVAVIAINLSQPEPVTLPSVGTIARVAGFEADATLAAGDELYPGRVLTTENAQGVSILLARNESLRLGENSRLRVDDRSRFTLLEGRVYADTGRSVYKDGGLEILAGEAMITDIGTQFSVAFDGATIDVGVREGRVDVADDIGLATAIAGERMQIDSSGEKAVMQLRPDADYWQWAAELAPRFDTEKKSLMDFLNWAARETGLQLVFENDELRMAAMRTDLHGPVSSFAPSDALDAVMATTQFQYRVEAGTIYISR